ncbi:MAG: mechanosensitive ion channel family protein [Armatimonadota bacterium]
MKVWSSEYWAGVWARHIESVLSAAARMIVILVAYFVVRFILLRIMGSFTRSMLAKVSKDRLAAREARIRSLHTLFSSTISFVLGFITLIMVLQAAGINVVPLLTTASVAGIAVGFGAQKLVRDWIAGIFILIEDQYGVGDIVTIGSVTGVVEELGMRTTRIRGEDGSLYIIPNGDIVQVCNRSRSADQ